MEIQINMYQIIIFKQTNLKLDKIIFHLQNNHKTITVLKFRKNNFRIKRIQLGTLKF